MHLFCRLLKLIIPSSKDNNNFKFKGPIKTDYLFVCHCGNEMSDPPSGQTDGPLTDDVINNKCIFFIIWQKLRNFCYYVTQFLFSNDWHSEKYK